MDAATRAELDGLRRRAYGPAPDLDDDEVVRLIELEDLVLEDRLVLAGASRTGAVAGVATTRPGNPRSPSPSNHPPTLPAVPPSVLPTAPATPNSPHPRIGVVAGMSAVTVVAALGIVALLRLIAPTEAPQESGSTLSPAFRDSRAAYSFALDTDAIQLLQIPLDGSFGNYIDLPAGGYVPEFPAKGEVEWATLLGEYFGWDVWIAGAAADSPALPREHCILIEHGAVTRARCVAAELRSQSALLVAVPFTFLSADERPVGMAQGDRLGFWWNHDRAVTVLLGDDPRH